MVWDSGSYPEMTFPLPPHKHMPGKNARHEKAAFDEILRAVEGEENVSTIANSPAWDFTLNLLEKGFYWEAHEVLEAIWMRAVPNSTEAIFLKGAIQIANCGLKRKMKNNVAADRLRKQAEEMIELAYRNGPDAKIMNLSKFEAMQLLFAHTR